MRRRAAALLLIVGALLMRVAVPAGWMPDASAPGLRDHALPGDCAHVPARDHGRWTWPGMAHAMDGKHAPASTTMPRARATSPEAAQAAALPDLAPAPGIAPLPAPPSPAVPGPPPPSPGRGLAAPPPPATGPPAPRLNRRSTARAAPTNSIHEERSCLFRSRCSARGRWPWPPPIPIRNPRTSSSSASRQARTIEERAYDARHRLRRSHRRHDQRRQRRGRGQIPPQPDRAEAPIGDTQAPLATRTAGLGASARSLIYADGALLSSLIGNNNTIASPRWGLVAPEEVARIDVHYGPFSAAYPGNSIGAVVNIVTRLPERLEASATALTNLQDFRQYATTASTRPISSPRRWATGSAPSRCSQARRIPTAAVSRSAMSPATRSAAPGTRRHGRARRFRRRQPHRRADPRARRLRDRAPAPGLLKLKAALDFSPALHLAYVGGLFLDDTSAGAETYLTSAASGAPLYSGSLNIAGYPYVLAASGFSNGVYTHRSRHWSQRAVGERNGGRARLGSDRHALRLRP
ncbi:MAG: hypothetical protein WDN44_06270 [Sphingomonas sp.]